MKTILSTSLRSALFAAVAICTTTLAPAAALSEMLEKGIYTEETKGDLDAAIGIYQQVLTDAKANIALAARAQYRLGLCYLKKNQTAEATAAFERLIKDYPGEEELVAAARKHLPAQFILGPVPWQDGEVMHLTLKLPSGLDMGAMTYHARAGNVDGRKTWQVGGRSFVKWNSASQVTVNAEDFRPITSWWKHGLLGEVTAEYGATEVQLQRADGSAPVKIPIEYPVYDNEEVVHLIRRLPLEVGYKTTIPLISTLGGVKIPLALEVKGRETVEVPAGKRECFQVELMPVSQRFWISADANRYVMKFDGGGVMGELVTVEQRQPGAPVVFQDPEIGVTLTAPADWLIHKQDPDHDEKSTSIYLLDPKGEAEICLVRLQTLASIPEEARTSARVWAESEVKAFAKRFKAFTVRPDSWAEVVVDGRPGISFIADYGDEGKLKTMGAVYALGSSAGQQFTLTAEPDAFVKLQPAFEGIVASFKATK